ncbi:hypothetical protein MTO96_016222 [Rhipicephalus appendiculatus]
MYSFDGEFRKRPQQSLGGASKKVGLDDLLRKSALRRQNREESRRQEEAALKIKAYGRGFLSRRRLARELRQKFDTTSRVSSDLGLLLCVLPHFYDAQVDAERLAWLSHQVLLRKDEVAGQADDPVWRLRIRRLLALNVMSLQRPGFPTARALRLLEVLGSAEAYHHCFRGCLSEEERAVRLRSWLQQLWFHLARRCSLFLHLYNLLEPWIPDPGPKEEGMPQVVTPKAQAMVDLLLLPLVKPVADGPECGDYQREIIACLLTGVLGDCPQVVRVVLPALATRWPYPGEPLLRAVLSLEPSPWLFQALLRLSSPAEPLFIAAAAHLSPCLTHKADKSSYEDLDTDELSPVDEIWSGDGYSSSTSLADEALEDVLQQLNAPSTVNTFLEAALSSRENLPALCQLGWALVQRRPLALHHFRLLYTLAFRPQFLRQLWEALKDVPCSVAVCARLLAHLLLTLHDVEFYESSASDPMPFSLDELVLLIAQLRELCLGLLELCFPDTRTSLDTPAVAVPENPLEAHVRVCSLTAATAVLPGLETALLSPTATGFHLGRLSVRIGCQTGTWKYKGCQHVARRH